MSHDDHHHHDEHETTGRDDAAFTRRAFIGRGLTLASLAATTPMFVERAALGMALPEGSLVSSRAGVPDHRILVVVQLGGGNDGLNTVVPYGMDAYHRLRPRLAVPAPVAGRMDENAAMPLARNGDVGLHPAFADFRHLFDEGKATIVQGVGYPNPNRSHFTSMDIWHTADPSGSGDGWLGRYFDHQCAGAPARDAARGGGKSPDPLGGVAFGNAAPRAMIGRTQAPVAFESPDRFRWTGGELHPALREHYDAIVAAGGAPAEASAPAPTGHAQLDYLTRTALDARVSAETIAGASASRPLADWPRGRLADQLRLAAAMIRAGLPTRVYYASLGGFDTHANQAAAHARLLREVGSSLRAFQAELDAQGDGGRVLTMVFSEFGRRVAQNASGGTDHGTAAPLYLVGDAVRPGLLGEHPSLERLDQGDLVHTVDFRSVYATILEQWMGADADAVLGGRFARARVLA